MFVKRGNKGQITIFIIIAILVVAMVALVFLFINRSNNKTPSESSAGTSPSNYLSTCVEEKLYEDLQTLSLQGGYFENPLSISFKFGDEEYRNISYLCYEENVGVPCVVQQPSIINHLEKELEISLDETTENCFNRFLQSLENEGYVSNGTYSKMGVDIKESKVVININSKLIYSKGEQSYSVDGIVFEYPTEIYGIGKVVQRILSDETKRNSFDRIDYMDKHPKYNINLYKIYDLNKIYIVENEDSDEEFRFAVRGGLY